MVPRACSSRRSRSRRRSSIVRILPRTSGGNHRWTRWSARSDHRHMDPREARLIRYNGEFSHDVIARASGSWLETVDGRRVLGFTSGQICAKLGHSHPRIVEAVQRALGAAVHLTSGMLSAPVLALAERVAALMPAGLARSMFLSPGGE